MKNLISSLILFISVVSGFSQDLNYGVKAAYTRPVHISNVRMANKMIDINPGYPSSWISHYISASLSATCNGTIMKAVSADDHLSTEQKNILMTVDMGSDIVVDIKYHTTNTVTGENNEELMHFVVTVVPEIEAQYLGGHQLLTQYLKENAVDKIAESTSKQLRQAVVRFTVDEQGEIANPQIAVSSEDALTDQLLLEAITSMPKWKPAESANGMKVKQEFEFSVGNKVSGC